MCGTARKDTTVVYADRAAPLRYFEIRGGDAFGEPAVARREQIAGFGTATVVAAERGEARGAGQFPGFRPFRQAISMAR
jgi:hypothetical protein